MIFLDANICTYVMRGAPSALLEKSDSFSGQLHVCSIVVAELEFGVINSLKKERNARALEALLERLGSSIGIEPAPRRMHVFALPPESNLLDRKTR
jgi:predicted nucleic acid-binding protein